MTAGCVFHAISMCLRISNVFRVCFGGWFVFSYGFSLKKLISKSRVRFCLGAGFRHCPVPRRSPLRVAWTDVRCTINAPKHRPLHFVDVYRSTPIKHLRGTTCCAIPRARYVCKRRPRTRDLQPVRCAGVTHGVALHGNPIRNDRMP